MTKFHVFSAVIIHGDGHQTLIRIRIYQTVQAAYPDLSESPGCRSGMNPRRLVWCGRSTLRPSYLNPTVEFTNFLKLMIAGWKASEVARCHRTETAGGGEERGLPHDQQRAAQAGTQVSPHGQRGDRLHQAGPRGSNHNQAGGASVVIHLL
jgi:hypothetical protein